KIKYQKQFSFDIYDYIVCDEFHYFISDGLFNNTTDVSLDSILTQNKVKIFMSATSFSMENYFKTEKLIIPISYKIEHDFDFIKNIYFFNDDKEHSILKNLLESSIDKNKKT